MKLSPIILVQCEWHSYSVSFFGYSIPKSLCLRVSVPKTEPVRLYDYRCFWTATFLSKMTDFGKVALQSRIAGILYTHHLYDKVTASLEAMGRLSHLRDINENLLSSCATYFVAHSVFSR